MRVRRRSECRRYACQVRVGARRGHSRQVLRAGRRGGSDCGRSGEYCLAGRPCCYLGNPARGKLCVKPAVPCIDSNLALFERTSLWRVARNCVFLRNNSHAQSSTTVYAVIVACLVDSAEEILLTGLLRKADISRSNSARPHSGEMTRRRSGS